jgi:hypothetical protein
MATYKPLQSISLTSDTTTVTFSGIPQDYTDLEVVISARCSHSSNCNFYYRVNGDTSSSYSVTRFQGNGSTAVSNRGSSNTVGYIGYADAADSSSSIFGVTKIYVNNYSNSTTYKTLLSKGATPGTSGYAAAFANLYRGSTSPITSISFTPDAGNWVAGSTFSLYGIKAGTPKAFGGDITTTDGTYWYHTFRTSGKFVVQQGTTLTADYLLVGGGGGGGGGDGLNYSGGGGAGGYRHLTSQSFSPNTEYTVLVGAGGNSPASGAAGLSGSASSIGTVYTSGGAGGGGGESSAPNSGGSGGGAGGSASNNRNGSSGNAGGYSPVEGYNGGNATAAPNPVFIGAAAGGGGSSQVGGSSNSSTLGVGGNGTANSISGTSVTYAGGGGGGTYASNTGFGGSGGTGGGGRGGNFGYSNSNPNPSTPGTANLGGGGGGGGSNGGSGIVIVRYAV